mgnify:CR=1 FL=1
MLDGTYVVSAATPIGAKRGELTFATGTDGRMRAALKVSGLNIVLTRAACTGDEFELAGTISHLLLGKAPFECKGSVAGDAMSAVARSGALSIELKGHRK